MNNMTAVESLIENILKHDKSFVEFYNAEIEQAKEMEKQQIIDFGVWYSGMEQEKVKKAFERYKNETK